MLADACTEYFVYSRTNHTHHYFSTAETTNLQTTVRALDKVIQVEPLLDVWAVSAMIHTGKPHKITNLFSTFT